MIGSHTAIHPADDWELHGHSLQRMIGELLVKQSVTIAGSEGLAEIKGSFGSVNGWKSTKTEG